MSFPAVRMRRLRRSPRVRDLVRETRLSPADFVWPIFVCPGKGIRREIGAMPGCQQMSVDVAATECAEAARLGIPAVILFGIPPSKDAQGSSAHDPQGVVPRAIREIKGRTPELVVVADVCLCEYTDHGHCGLIRDGEVDNDSTLEILARAAVCYAEAGADVVAPSDMMDGRVGRIRRALDEANRPGTLVLSYAAKYASAFYGPFREAAESPPRFGDRRGYQMDPGNVRQALREVALDIEEGADMVLVKPALPYLDVLYRVRQAFPVPVGAYNVSGEFSMVRAAAANGWLDGRLAALEMLTSIKRAGADFILTYFAREVAAEL